MRDGASRRKKSRVRCKTRQQPRPMEERRKVGGRTFAGDHHKEPLPACTTLCSPAAVRDASGRRSRPRSEQAVGCNTELECCMCATSGVEWLAAHAFSLRRRHPCVLWPDASTVRSRQRAGPRESRGAPAGVPPVASGSQCADAGLALSACSLALQKLDPAIVPLRGDEARVRPEHDRDQRESERGGRNEKRYKSPAQRTCCAAAASSEIARNARPAAERL